MKIVKTDKQNVAPRNLYRATLHFYSGDADCDHHFQVDVKPKNLAEFERLVTEMFRISEEEYFYKEVYEWPEADRLVARSDMLSWPDQAYCDEEYKSTPSNVEVVYYDQDGVEWKCEVEGL